MLRTQLIGRTLKVPGEVFDGANVTIDGGLRVVPTLEFLEHDLAKMRHRNPSFSASHLRSAHSKLLAYDTRKRPPFHGFVQVRFREVGWVHSARISKRPQISGLGEECSVL